MSCERLIRELENVQLQDAMDLFARLGVDVQSISRREFTMRYFALARRYHPDRNPATLELMANINAARTTILKSSGDLKTIDV